MSASSPSIGVVYPAGAAVESLPAFARQMEHVGFDEVWVVEDCFLSGGLVMAATVLAVTDRLRVGLGLMPAPVRNPAIAAMELGALAQMHPGRFTAAFGHGVPSWMAQIGALPERRLAALGETTSVVRRLLAGENVTVWGSHVRLSEVALDHPPSSPPGVLIGTTGPRGLGVAGRTADGILVPEGCGPDFVAWARSLASADRPGDATGPLETVVYVWLSIADDDQRGRDGLRTAVERWSVSGLFPEPVARSGIELPLSGSGITQAVADALAIAGGAQSCAAGVRRFADAGADRILVFAAEPSAATEQYVRFAEEVLPIARGSREA